MRRYTFEVVVESDAPRTHARERGFCALSGAFENLPSEVSMVSVSLKTDQLIDADEKPESVEAPIADWDAEQSK